MNEKYKYVGRPAVRIEYHSKNKYVPGLCI
jgi:hypothetical protein